MNRRILFLGLAAVAVAVLVGSSNAQAGLFAGLATCKPACCEPACCEPATCEPATCEPATCEPATCAPKTCRPKCGLFARLRGRLVSTCAPKT